MKVKELLNLRAEVPLDIILANLAHGADPQEVYHGIQKQLQKKVEPKVLNYMNSLNLEVTLADIKDIAVLSATEIHCMTLEIKEAIAAVLDSFRTLADFQKVFLTMDFIMRYKAHVQNYVKVGTDKRAREIMVEMQKAADKPGLIIKPPGFN